MSGHRQIEKWLVTRFGAGRLLGPFTADLHGVRRLLFEFSTVTAHFSHAAANKRFDHIIDLRLSLSIANSIEDHRIPAELSLNPGKIPASAASESGST